MASPDSGTTPPPYDLIRVPRGLTDRVVLEYRTSYGTGWEESAIQYVEDDDSIGELVKERLKRIRERKPDQTEQKQRVDRYCDHVIESVLKSFVDVFRETPESERDRREFASRIAVIVARVLSP